MIAERMSPDVPMAILGLPTCFGTNAVPEQPEHLVEHRAINLRLPTTGFLNAWRFIKDGREIRVRVDGPLVFNTIDLILDAAIDGIGLAYIPLYQVTGHLASRRLIRVLTDSTAAASGLSLLLFEQTAYVSSIRPVR